MKPDVKAMGATLAAAREFIATTRQALEDLRRRRAALNLDSAELEAKPLLWAEAVDEIAERAIDDRAAAYKPSLASWIRTHNPGLAARTGYNDLPFLGTPDVESQARQSIGLDGCSASAMCFFFGDELKVRLRTALLTYPEPPFPADQCISGKDREAQRAALRKQLDAIDRELATLQGELAELQLEG